MTQDPLQAARAEVAASAAERAAKINLAAIAIADGKKPDLAGMSAADLDEVGQLRDQILQQRQEDAEVSALLEELPRARDAVREAHERIPVLEQAVIDAKAAVDEQLGEASTLGNRPYMIEKRLRQLRPSVFFSIGETDQALEAAEVAFRNVHSRLVDVQGGKPFSDGLRESARAAGKHPSAANRRRATGLIKRAEFAEQTSIGQAKVAVAEAGQAYLTAYEDSRGARAGMGREPRAVNQLYADWRASA
ncbi:MAG: hypothetical protein JKY65_18320 [Planctomycetes bacterium]|nr:hypothetical protein [Planctomycetota bacterium]